MSLLFQSMLLIFSERYVACVGIGNGAIRIDRRHTIFVLEFHGKYDHIWYNTPFYITRTFCAVPNKIPALVV